MPVVGIDVGGTFTDVVSWSEGSLTITKVATTANPDDAVVAAVEEGVERLLHGTTAATNALLERRGAETVLITSSGFEDVIEIGRQDRPSLYDGDADRPHPLVARHHRVSAVEAVAGMGAEAVAVSLLGAHLDASAERQIADDIRSRMPAAALSVSHLVSPEVREFERTSTTILNAYLQPTIAGYLARLRERLTAVGHLTIMRSSGGLMAAGRAAEQPAAILLSGPAGGTTAAAALATAMGRSRVISFDMGGTSTDVSRIEEGRPEVGYERSIDGFACRLPAVAIHTVGAGGGSIAWRDPGGALAVGPRSAGARPGPACYGRGGSAPTVTDANLALGRMPARLGDQLSLDRAAAAAALDALDLGSGTAAAAGVIAIVEENMTRAIRRVSVEEGADPAEASLIAFGGAGGLHATSLARSLGMASVIIPPWPGVFSALGLLLAPSRADATIATPPGADERALTAAVTAAADAAAADLSAMTGRLPSRINTLVDVRYRGQSHEITVPWSADSGWESLVGSFHEVHRERNGFARPDDPIEVVAARAEATGPAEIDLGDIEIAPEPGPAARGETTVIEDGIATPARRWWRPALSGEVVGPALLIEDSATTYLATGERATVAPSGALELEW